MLKARVQKQNKLHLIKTLIHNIDPSEPSLGIGLVSGNSYSGWGPVTNGVSVAHRVSVLNMHSFSIWFLMAF